MPNIVWEPRTCEFGYRTNVPNSWSGTGFVLDEDKMVLVPPYVLEAALGVAANYVIYWVSPPVGINTEGDPRHVIIAKDSGANYKMYILDGFTLGAEIALGGAAFAIPDEVGLTNIGWAPFYTSGGDTQAVITTDTGIATLSTDISVFTDIAAGDFSNTIDVTTHLARAIAICHEPPRVYWSDSGTISTWTGGSSGNTILSNERRLLGIRTVSNRLVILGESSIHYGILTGDNRVYRFEQVVSNTDVLRFPTTLAQNNDELYYMGSRGTYRFKDGRQESIGDPVWPAIRPIIGKNAEFGDFPGVYRGLITTGLELPQDEEFFPDRDDLRYVLVPIRNVSVNTPGILCLSYNITQGAWEAFNNTSSPPPAWAYNGDIQNGAITFMRQTGNQISHMSSPDGTISRSYELTSHVFSVDDITRDYQTDCCYITYFDDGVYTFDLTVLCELNSVTQTVTKSVTIGNSSPTHRDLTRRVPIGGDDAITGNHFKMSIDGSSTNKTQIHIRRLTLTLRDAGERRN